MRLLFLDIDGVLNRHVKNPASKVCGIEPECMNALNRILRSTDCKICLVSAWRYMILNGAMTLDGFWYMLRTHGLYAFSDDRKDNPIIGTTHPDRHIRDGEQQHPHERAHQVMAYMEQDRIRHTLQGYCVVDDLDLGYTANKMHYVDTLSDTGLRMKDADIVVELLNKPFRFDDGELGPVAPDEKLLFWMQGHPFRHMALWIKQDGTIVESASEEEVKDLGVTRRLVSFKDPSELGLVPEYHATIYRVKPKKEGAANG